MRCQVILEISAVPQCFGTTLGLDHFEAIWRHTAMPTLLYNAVPTLGFIQKLLMVSMPESQSTATTFRRYEGRRSVYPAPSPGPTTLCGSVCKHGHASGLSYSVLPFPGWSLIIPFRADLCKIEHVDHFYPKDRILGPHVDHEDATQSRQLYITRYLLQEISTE